MRDDDIGYCAIAQVLRWRKSANSPGIRDALDVTTHAQDRRMTVHLICPWCADEVAFEVDHESDELLCSACGTSFDFAPDPVVTYALLYEAA
jgi:hypothetical protein